jgi:hypothetical protein
MNCDLVKRRLMSSEDPGLAPPDLRGHLATCEQCRDWQRQLVQVERHIPLLPVPGSRGRAGLLQRFVTAPGKIPAKTVVAASLGTVAAVPPVPPAPPPRRPLPLVRLAAAAAALFLLAALGARILTTSHRRPAETGAPAVAVRPRPPDRLLAGLVRHDGRLATAATIRERLDILADVADEILDPAGALAAETRNSHLEALARLFERVVREGILKQAQSLPPAERPAILPAIAGRLARTAQRIDRLVEKVPAQQNRPLQHIAGAAREANRQLASLVTEVRS